MKLLKVAEVLEIHRAVVEQAGGIASVRDLRALESAVAQPRASFDGNDLYPSIEEKAAALGFSLIRNHPFTDGNKRVGHAAIEVTLWMNGIALCGSVEEAERVILGVAAGTASRDELVAWVRRCVVPG